MTNRPDVLPPPLLPLPDTALERIFRLKHGDPRATGPGPAMRFRHGYFTPDDHYEAAVDALVTPGCRWLDVGCGRDIFPQNPALARELAARAGWVTGVDPSPNVLDNPFLQEKIQDTLESWDARTQSDPPAPFDLATLRMVAEHVADPQALVLTLARRIRPGGRIIIFTVNRWSPVTLAAFAVPFRWHHALKSVVWGTEERDTFPVVYRMNTRNALRNVFRSRGFTEVAFAWLDDCRTFFRFPRINRAELLFWRACRRLGRNYPETCLLGIYQRDEIS